MDERPANVTFEIRAAQSVLNSQSTADGRRVCGGVVREGARMGTPFSENFCFGSAVPGSSERSSQAGAMSCSVRLLGPDLPNCLVVENLPLDMTVLGLKERALGSWPAGAHSSSARSRCCTAAALRRIVACAIRTELPSHAPTGMDVPLIGQIKIILMGRFLPDEKPLSGVLACYLDRARARVPPIRSLARTHARARARSFARTLVRSHDRVSTRALSFLSFLSAGARAAAAAADRAVHPCLDDDEQSASARMARRRRCT